MIPISPEVAAHAQAAPTTSPAVEQSLVLAREISAQPGTTVLVIDYARGEWCAWCDCSAGPGAPDKPAQAECAGCTSAAECVVRVVQAGEDRCSVAACSQHLAETARTIALMAALPV